MRTLSALCLLFAAGCPLPRTTADSGAGPQDASVDVGGLDSGTEASTGFDAAPAVDSGYDPGTGNLFTGTVIFDDERVGELDPSTLFAGDRPCREPILARIRQVVDGDTVRITAVSEPLSTNVRMIGVDTPEIDHAGGPDECYGREATVFTQQLEGRLVWLTFDGTCLDPFDRLLAYVHIGPGPQDVWERQLLQRGFGTLLVIGRNDSLEGVLRADESSARSGNRGLFEACD